MPRSTRPLVFTRFRPDGRDGEVWTGPWVEPGFALDEVIASWAADVPPGAVLELALQARTGDGDETLWYVLARWDTSLARTSVPGQDDEHGTVATDTFRAVVPLVAYRLRVSSATHVRALTAIASRRDPFAASMSSDPSGVAVDLDVPGFSQSIHANEHPELGGGGAAWCSAASTAMVVAFWGVGPSETHAVVAAAHGTYDAAYDGTGNWPFNTAYAAGFGLDAFVTRLRSLREAELFLEAGIPLVASIVAGPGQLDGFLLPQGTEGHLVVIAGFTPNGDPIVNDPAAPSNDAVRRSYPRAQFERVWLEGSGGVVYVITPPGTALPPSTGNW